MVPINARKRWTGQNREAHRLGSQYVTGIDTLRTRGPIAEVEVAGASEPIL
jgi:hypothetical protein